MKIGVLGTGNMGRALARCHLFSTPDPSSSSVMLGWNGAHTAELKRRSPQSHR
jgi:hypothetical protein